MRASKAEVERLIGVPLYLMLNWLPFLMPLVSAVVGGWRGILLMAALLALFSLKPAANLLYAALSNIPRALGVPVITEDEWDARCAEAQQRAAAPPADPS